MLANLAVVLVRTKFSENVGGTARAMANMGCRELRLVNPVPWEQDRSLGMATAQAADIVTQRQVYPDLDQALSERTAVYATTARTGGWRKGIISPAQAATEIAAHLAEGGRPAVVFGPEDRGLGNEDTQRCEKLICIPTDREATSLNLAQAVLIILYECFKASLETQGKRFEAAGPPPSRFITHQEREAMFQALQEALLAMDYLKQDNPEYWMLPVRRFFSRMDLKRNEFNLLMGVCRQSQWMAQELKRLQRTGESEDPS